MANAQYLDITDLRGGRNGEDAPLSLAPDQCVAAVNVDWSAGTLGRKRDGMAAVSMAGSGLTTSPLCLIRHTPTADERQAELWATDAGSHIGRYSGGAWSAPVPADAINVAAIRGVRGCSLNGKLFLAYKSAVDRLHVWDGTSLRRAGLAAPAAPTGANAGSGSYAATKRWYRVRLTAQSSGITLRRSEPSSKLAFTPSGTGTSVTVTFAGVPANESATHWELYASNDDGNYWLISTLPVATTTFSDSTAPSNYSLVTGTVDYDVAEYLPFPSVRYLMTDENRLIGAGSWENDAYGSRLFFSPTTTSGTGDDERWPDSNDWMNHLDLDNRDGGGITGLGGPINNSPYAFKLSQTYKLVRTGKAKNPYRPVTISKTVGSINQESIVEGVDESDSASLYFLALDGPRRISSANGMQWLGNDVRDIWKTVNFNASVISHAVYYRDLRQVWFWVATGTSDTPNTILVFDTRRGRSTPLGVQKGWSVYTGALATALSSVMFASTLGATVSINLKPYVGVNIPSLLAKAGTGTNDDGTLIPRAYVKTKPHLLAGLGKKCGVMDGTLLAVAGTGVSVQVSVERDFGVEQRDFTVSLTPEGSESRVIRQVEDLSMADATSLTFEIGDAEAADNGWTLEGLTVLPRLEGGR